MNQKKSFHFSKATTELILFLLTSAILLALLFFSSFALMRLPRVNQYFGMAVVVILPVFSFISALIEILRSKSDPIALALRCVLVFGLFSLIGFCLFHENFSVSTTLFHFILYVVLSFLFYCLLLFVRKKQKRRKNQKFRFN